MIDEGAGIVEEKAATAAQKKIREINAGFYAFDAGILFKNIDKLSTDNPHAEFYLTDMAKILGRARARVVAVAANDPYEVLGGNTRAELVDIDSRLRRAKCMRLMAEGVTIFAPETCVIDDDVEVGPDTVIEPFVQLQGSTRIGADCRIRSYSVIKNSDVGEGVMIKPGTIMEDARVATGAIIGPYSHLRPGSEIEEGAHVGNFVETKKVRLGKGSKANHLTYLGDADIGSGVNIGAGTITCNYDGADKHHTDIGKDAFIGSNSALVAPFAIGEGAYIGSGSVITRDVPAGALAVGRGRQVVKEGWAARLNAKKQAGKKRAHASD
jgi:bifunctional UDP-N-acetylglucosamine pyrophosphorylase/glucosamine-1-phosphate N-acetyltransferase